MTITFVISIQALVLLAGLTLMLLISRRGSRVAKWISIVLFIGGIPIFFHNGIPDEGSPAVSVAQFAGQFVAYALLFTPSAQEWFAKRKAAD